MLTLLVLVLSLLEKSRRFRLARDYSLYFFCLFVLTLFMLVLSLPAKSRKIRLVHGCSLYSLFMLTLFMTIRHRLTDTLSYGFVILC